MADNMPFRQTRVTRRHDVFFYSCDEIFLKSVVPFIGAALMGGNAAIVIATKPHRESLLYGLKAEGLDVDDAIQRGSYVSLDAFDTLSTFMVDDWPDAARFFQGFSALIKSASKAAKAEHPRVAVFGEAGGLLWAEGKTVAALRLEQLGNALADVHQVDILCGYPFSLCIQENDNAFRTICAEHSSAYSE